MLDKRTQRAWWVRLPTQGVSVLGDEGARRPNMHAQRPCKGVRQPRGFPLNRRGAKGCGTARSLAAPGQDVGRWRSIRAWSGLPGGATLQRVRRSGVGGAGGPAGGESACGGGGPGGGHRQRTPASVAWRGLGKVVAEVRSLWSAPWTALLAVSQCPRAPSRSSTPAAAAPPGRGRRRGDGRQRPCRRRGPGPARAGPRTLPPRRMPPTHGCWQAGARPEPGLGRSAAGSAPAPPA